MSPKPATTAATGETLYTPYYVLESRDEGRTWTYLGEQAAGDSAAALRKFFNDPPRDSDAEDVLHVAVAKGSFKPRRVVARVKTSISEAEMPDVSAKAPEQEELPVS